MAYLLFYFSMSTNSNISSPPAIHQDELLNSLIDQCETLERERSEGKAPTEKDFSTWNEIVRHITTNYI